MIMGQGNAKARPMFPSLAPRQGWDPFGKKPLRDIPGSHKARVRLPIHCKGSLAAKYGTVYHIQDLASAQSPNVSFHAVFTHLLGMHRDC